MDQIHMSFWKLCLFISILTASRISAGLDKPFSSSIGIGRGPSVGCSWTQPGSLNCHVRTLNVDFWNNSTMSISPGQRSGVTSIHISCNDKLFFESFLSSNQSLFSLPKLNSVSIESCKIRKLSQNINWRRLPGLKYLAIQTGNVEWSSSVELEIEPGAFANNGFGLGVGSGLEVLDLSFNNIWSLPAHLFCPLTSLKVLNLSRNHLIELPQEFGSVVQGRGASERELSYCALSVTNLDFSHNSIRKMDSNALSRLKRLLKLNLSFNSVDELEDSAFGELEHLKLLNLTSNRLVALPPSIFRSNTELSELYLQNNSISALSPSVFSSLQQLLLLDLSRNLLSTQWIKENVFSGLIRLIVLKLSYNQLSFIDSGLFAQLSSLQALYLSHNRIERLDPNAFSSLTNLHVLDLSRNLLTFIDAKQFSNSYILKQLYLDHNRLRTIDVESFANCTSLQDLGLAGNLLLEVPAALRSKGSNRISNLVGLKTLDLGENKISFVTNDSFSGLSKLYGLRMVDNRVSELPDHFCSSLKNLRVLNFGQNRLKRIAPSAFVGCPETRALRLDKNQLEQLPNYSAQLPKLLWLNLTENRLKYINPHHLPVSLEWIDLSWNQLESLGDMYQDLEPSASQLRVLDASHNNLTQLDYRSLPPSLETLRLNNNKIKSIASDTFIRAPRLRKIELTENELEVLPLASLRFSTFQIGASIPEISLSGNPFSCHCELEWSTRLGQLGLQRQYPKLVDYDQLECSSLLPGLRSEVSSNIKIQLRVAKPSDFLCPYKSLCFPLCQCCEFEACDCNYECPDNCTCHHDTAWSANIVQCSSTLDGQNIPPRIPMDATQLFLDGNQLPNLPSHAFIGKRNLRLLYLNSSRIQLLKNKTFNGLKSLEKLHLQDNLLTQLDGFEFIDLENLVELYLHNNLLKYITPESFASLKLLQVLRLDGNLLHDFSLWELSKNSYLNSVMLSSNPWSCDCEFIIPFRTWVASRSSAIVDFPLAKCQMPENGSSGDENLNQLATGPGSVSVLIGSRCNIIEEINYNHNGNHVHAIQNHVVVPASNPDQNLNPNLAFDDSESGPDEDLIMDKYNKNQLLQNNNTSFDPNATIFWAIFSSLAIILTFTLLVLMIIFRKQLQFWISHHNVLPCVHNFKCSSSSGSNDHGPDSDDDEKLFDAYFLYSRKDSDLVSYKICPELESIETPTGAGSRNLTHRSLRLCLHFRDLCLNVESHPWNPELIQTACEVSKRVVIVLSQTFLQNEWTKPEFRLALSSVLSAHQKKLIFILCPPLTEHNLVGLFSSMTSLRTNNNNSNSTCSGSNQRNYKGNALEWTDENFWTKFKLLLPSNSYAGSYTDTGSRAAVARNCRHHLNNSISSNQHQQQQQQPCYNITRELQQQPLPNYTLNRPNSEFYSQYLHNSQTKGSQLSPVPAADLSTLSRYYANNLNSTIPVQWPPSAVPPFRRQGLLHGHVSPGSSNNNNPPLIPYHYDSHRSHAPHVNQDHQHNHVQHQHVNQQSLHLLANQFKLQNDPSLASAQHHLHQNQNSISTISNTYRPLLTEQNYSDSTATKYSHSHSGNSNASSCSNDELDHIYSTLDSPILQSQGQGQSQSQSQHAENSSSLTRIEFVHSNESLNLSLPHCLSQSLGLNNHTNASSSGISSCEELGNLPSESTLISLSHMHSKSALSDNSGGGIANGQMYFV